MLDLNLKKGSTIVIALSGGPDSVYLLHALKNQQKKLKLTLIGAHLNHSTRFFSNKDERFCKRLCKENQITFESKKLSFKNKSNFEATAREARYAFFDEIKKKHNADYIVTGHHLNDSIETILLNLTRGTGIKGLTGISDRDDIVRPLQNLTKKEIIQSLVERKLKYRIDSTNKSNAYTRNKIRNKVIPTLKTINPELEATFAKNIRRFNEVEQYLKKQSNDWIKNNFDQKNESFDLKEFLKLDEVIKRYVLEEIQKKYDRKTPLSESHIKNILSILSKKKNAQGKLGTLPFKVSYGNVSFKKNSKQKKHDYKVREIINSESLLKKIKAGKKNTIYIRCVDTNKLALRYWKKGDSFRPLNMKGTKKLQDFFTDKKIPQSKRSNIPLILYNKEIVAVGDITISDKYKVTPETKKVTQITLV